MKIKCRGYEGDILSLEAYDTIERNEEGYLQYKIDCYEIVIRVMDGVEIMLKNVKRNEIEVINE